MKWMTTNSKVISSFLWLKEFRIVKWFVRWMSFIYECDGSDYMMVDWHGFRYFDPDSSFFWISKRKSDIDETKCM